MALHLITLLASLAFANTAMAIEPFYNDPSNPNNIKPYLYSEDVQSLVDYVRTELDVEIDAASDHWWSHGSAAVSLRRSSLQRDCPT